MSAVSSLMRSIGNGGEHSGFIAMLISFIGLSDAVRGHRTASAATVDYRPLAVFPHPDRYGVHDSPAVRSSVSGLDINMQARKAVRAMVSVVAARSLRHYSASAHFADKSLVAGVSLIITFFVLFAFVFAIHFSS